MGGEGDNRGWDGWTASLTRWTWVWASSGSWRWTGKPDRQQSMGLQSWTQLSDWTELKSIFNLESAVWRWSRQALSFSDLVTLASFSKKPQNRPLLPLPAPSFVTSEFFLRNYILDYAHLFWTLITSKYLFHSNTWNSLYYPSGLTVSVLLLFKDAKYTNKLPKWEMCP